MVSGWLDDELIGYAFGSPGGDTAATWAAVDTALPDIPVPDEPEPIYLFASSPCTPTTRGEGTDAASTTNCS
jgi:hypothetical protein